MEAELSPSVLGITMPENLAVGLMIAEHRARCASRGCDFEYAAFALGQSPFPVPDVVAAALREAASHGEYVPTLGIRPLLEQLPGFWARHFGMQRTADDFVVVPGAKAGIHLLLSMLRGPLLIPTPAWVGYGPLATLVGKAVERLPTDQAVGYKLDPERLESHLRAASPGQRLLILNSPNNPTGAVYTREELAAIAAVCRRNGVLVISDEIYALSTYDPTQFVSMAAVYPEGTFVVSGLSKFAAAGGYRLGLVVLPSECSADHRQKVGAATYSNVTTLVQFAAIPAFADSPVMVEYLADTRSLHALMARELQRRLRAVPGARICTPDGGFYFMLDLNDVAPRAAARGLESSGEVAAALLGHPIHVALLAGEATELPAEDLSFRVAFVDYDGAAAMRRYRAERPAGPVAEAQFVEAAAPRMTEGVERLSRWIEAL